jgi:hypothetical protein
LGVLLKNYEDRNVSTPLPQEVTDHIASALHIALNDYTVTERGDVGALVRLEALATIETAWRTTRITGLVKRSSLGDLLYADVLRLSLEKLDKMRARAAHVLEEGALCGYERAMRPVADGVSSYTYFSSALMILQPEIDHRDDGPKHTVDNITTDDEKRTESKVRLHESLCLGLVSSAGMGSESVVQNSRAALLDTLDRLPAASTNEEEMSLQYVANCLVDLLKKNLDTDRTLLPLLEVIAFLFDMQIMHRLIPTTFK